MRTILHKVIESVAGSSTSAVLAVGLLLAGCAWQVAQRHVCDDCHLWEALRGMALFTCLLLLALSEAVCRARRAAIRIASFAAGAEVTGVDDGRAARAEATAARHRGEPFDVILMDMQMPVLDDYAAKPIHRGSLLALVAGHLSAVRGA